MSLELIITLQRLVELLELKPGRLDLIELLSLDLIGDHNPHPGAAQPKYAEDKEQGLLVFL